MKIRPASAQEAPPQPPGFRRFLPTDLGRAFRGIDWGGVSPPNIRYLENYLLDGLRRGSGTEAEQRQLDIVVIGLVRVYIAINLQTELAKGISPERRNNLGLILGRANRVAEGLFGGERYRRQIETLGVLGRLNAPDFGRPVETLMVALGTAPVTLIQGARGLPITEAPEVSLAGWGKEKIGTGRGRTSRDEWKSNAARIPVAVSVRLPGEKIVASIDSVIAFVAKYFRVEREALTNDNCDAANVQFRTLAIYLAKKVETSATSQEIAKVFWPGRPPQYLSYHVGAAFNAVRARMKREAGFARFIASLEACFDSGRT